MPPEQEQIATEQEHRASAKFQCLLLLTNLAKFGTQERKQLLSANAARLATPQLQGQSNPVYSPVQSIPVLPYQNSCF